MYKGERKEEERAGDKREGGKVHLSSVSILPPLVGRSPEEGGFMQLQGKSFALMNYCLAV